MKKFYIETFGCQMNVHDSEKVAGTLVALGYSQVDSPEQAELVLYNTCSIRDKAEQKVYSRLQQFKRNGNGRLFGVLGCVAQQEGMRIFERAPHVNLVCGSASYGRLPELLAELENGNRRVAGLALDGDDTFETPYARRDNPYRAYITIIEGCDKACAYCVVPFTRGKERSRTSAQHSGGRAASGRLRLHRDPVAGPERQQLPGSVTGRLQLCGPAGPGRGNAGTPAGQIRDVPSSRFRKGHRGSHRQQPGALRSCASSGSIRLDQGAHANAAALYAG